MKLIITPEELSKEFLKLLNQYDKFYWATAWASASSEPFKSLAKQKQKISQITVGIHFYQTHPDFIEAFLDDPRVRFIEQPAGTFHPKLYLFYTSPEDWTLISGSANFTREAFTRNTEANILVTSKSENAKEILKQALKLVKSSFQSGKTFNEKDLENYRIVWNNQRSKISSLSGKYGNDLNSPKPIYNSDVVKMSWKAFFGEVKSEKSHGLQNRIKVLDIAKGLFGKKDHFSQLEEDERKFIAGIPNKLDETIEDAWMWGYFGSMMGAGIYKNRIINNDKNISLALDQIPLSGQITKSHYDSFLRYYTKTFSGNYLGTATRLLAMKRPDTFVCLDSKNRSELCRHFGIKQIGMNYERYWDEIILRIFDSEWWVNPSPSSPDEIAVSNARSAFLDSLYYEQ